MPNPIAVLISDIHFSVPTLELASQSLLKAQFKAKMLNVPLVIAGDLHDTKANMRAECVNKLKDMFSVVDAPDTIVLVGNHDLCNERGKEHALNFLKPYATIIENPQTGYLNGKEVMLIPYYSDVEALRVLLKDEDTPKTIIMHQGIEGSNAGDYIQDKSALKHEDVADFRVISGHYHSRQDIKTGRPRKGAVGLWSYIGNPYTLNYAEANDLPKGFQILYDDGILEFIPTMLRRHVVYEIEFNKLETYPGVGIALQNDLLWVKLSGTKEQLSTITKAQVHKIIARPESFRLDLIPTDLPTNLSINTQNLTQMEVLDSIIGSLSDTSEERKERLKDLWKNLK